MPPAFKADARLVEFAEQVKGLNCKYFVVRNVDELVEALERE